MKTNTTIRIASISFVSAALLFASVTTASANSSRNEMKEKEAATAIYRLDNLNSSIESSIRFVAPEVNPGEDMLNFENGAEALEVNQAVERLDELNRKIEYSIYFQAPAAE
jgi:hypothetical protein